MPQFGPDGGPSPGASGSGKGFEKPPPPPPSAPHTQSTAISGGGTSVRSSSSGGGHAPVSSLSSDDELEREIRGSFPQYAFLLDNPEVRPLLLAAERGRRGEAGGIDEVTFTARLHATNWWKTTSESRRNWDALVGSDPASAEAQRQGRVAELRDMVGQMGAAEAFGGDYYAIANHTLALGLGGAEIRDFLVGQLRAGFGAVANMPVVSQMRQLASDYMIPLADTDYDWWARGILAGDRTAEQFQSVLQNLSVGRFPHLASQIQSGITPGQYFSSYKNLIAQELEVNPDSIDFMRDSRWQNVISYNDAGQLRPMTLAEATVYARKQPEWGKTRGAQQGGAELTQHLLEVFGATRA